MRTLQTLGLATLALIVLAGAAVAQTYTPGAGFTGSPHDFSGAACIVYQKNIWCRARSAWH